jgi:hypothetical protein
VSRRAGTIQQGAAIAVLNGALAQSTLLELYHSDAPGVNAWDKEGRARRTSHEEVAKITLAGLLSRALYLARDSFTPNTAQRGYELAADAVLYVAESKHLGRDLHEINANADRPQLQELLREASVKVRNEPETIPSKGELQ